MSDFPEKDWKYLASIKQGLLEALSLRINEQARSLLDEEGVTEFEKSRALYRHVRDSDDIVAECFDDWRRSRFFLRCIALRKHGLLTDEHMACLSARTQESIKSLQEVF